MKKNLKILVSLFIIFAFFILISNVYAASANITTSATSIKIGETANITVSVQDAEAWNLTVGKSGGSLTGNTASAESAGKEVSQTVITNTFTSSTAGTYTVSLSGQITGNDLVAANVSKSVTITVVDPTPPPVQEPEPPVNNTVENNTPGENTTGTTEPTQPEKSSDADLITMGITPNDFYTFKRYITKYDITVPKNVEKVNVYAKKSSDKATVEGTGDKTLKIGENVVEVTVTAEDGTKKVYTMNITRTEEEEIKSTNAKLRSITITPTGLTPDFDKEKNEYTLKVGNDVEEIKVSATKDDEKSKYEVIGNTSLKEGENEVKIIVTAEDGTTNIYVIKVTREPKDVFGLKELSLIGITAERKNIEINLSPDFSASVTEYICKLNENISNATVTALSNKEDAKIEILGDKDLEIGENTITIIVKSADEKETKTYQIIITNPSIDESIVVNTNTIGDSEEDDKSTMKKVIYIVCIAIITIMGISYAVIEFKYRRKGKEEIDYDYDFIEDYVNKNPHTVSEVNRFSKSFLEGLEKQENEGEEKQYNLKEKNKIKSNDEDDDDDEFEYKVQDKFEDEFEYEQEDEEDDSKNKGRRTGRRFK